MTLIILKVLCGMVLSKIPIAMRKTTKYTIKRLLFIHVSGLIQDVRWYKLLGEESPVIYNVQSFNYDTNTALRCKHFQHLVLAATWFNYSTRYLRTPNNSKDVKVDMGNKRRLTCLGHPLRLKSSNHWLTAYLDICGYQNSPSISIQRLNWVMCN